MDVLHLRPASPSHIEEFRAKAAAVGNGYCSIHPEEDPTLRMTVMRISIIPDFPRPPVPPTSSSLIESCINNAIMDVEVRDTYAQIEGERRSS